MIVTSQGKVIRLAVDGIRVIGRATQGVRLIDLGNEDTVVSIAKVQEQEP